MSEWISVKDRLPEDPEQPCVVLWWGFDRLHPDIAYLRDKWNGQTLWSGQRGSHNDVQFWAPLKEFPK